MKKTPRQSGFALAFTLVLMALIAIIVVAYLSSTRIERSTAAVHANRLRAKMTADSGLAAAIHLLKDNTRYGNYITAMPAPSPSPAARYTEIYRPTDAADATHAVKANEYLQLTNAAGEVLVSRATTASGPSTPQADPRPSPEVVPVPPATFALSNLSLTNADSYDFNQIVRLGTNNSGRLVNPDGQPAYGQWVRVRNPNGDIIGRYAFFIEDESMKVNVNVTGNNVGGSNSRVNDLALPAVSPAPATQIEEIEPAGVLPSPGANRTAAGSTLTSVGTSGARLASKGSVGVLDTTNWQTNFANVAHMMSVLSREDVTTARGWQRLDLNALVAGAADNTAKVLVAQRIANWIRDAWTGAPPVASLKDYQMFADERLRLQLAANIIDYIDADSTPTDLGNYPDVGVVPPAAGSTGYPVIGIEKIPYLVELDVVYTANDISPPTPGRAVIGMSFRLNFFNMYEKDLVLGGVLSKIQISGVPVIVKNGVAIFKHDTDPPFEIVIGGSATKDIADASVPWGGDNVTAGVAGVRTFQTGEVLSQQVSYTPGGDFTRFESGLIKVDLLDATGKRLDSARIALRDLDARWDDSGSSDLTHDFLEVSPRPQAAASINGTWEAVVGATGTISPIDFGDPRYRPSVATRRWYNLTRTDTTRFATSTDKAEMDCRAYSVDWYDYIGNRPLLFHRDGSMLNVGELGNVAACEYPWRTLYLQYAGRSHNTADPDVAPAVQDRRGSSAAAATDSTLLPQDHVLIDLFKTSSPHIRSGSININSQFNLPVTPTPTPTATPTLNQGVFTSLFASVPTGGGVSGAAVPTILSASATRIMATIVAGRRNNVSALSTGGPGPPGGTVPIDNNPRRPYFTIGQLASDISWLINQSENATMTGNGRTRTSVNYSLLRPTPTSSFWNRNYGTDMQVEEPFRKVSNSITTRGNVFRVLYVGQTLKNGLTQAEYLGECFVERQAKFDPEGSNPDAMSTSDSTYKVLSNRLITE